MGYQLDNLVFQNRLNFADMKSAKCSGKVVEIKTDWKQMSLFEWLKPLKKGHSFESVFM